MHSYHLAQLNLAQLKYELDTPEMQDFVDNIEQINLLAEQSPGFVWRLKTDAGDATAIDYFGRNMLVNMSLWTDLDSLQAFVYRSSHSQFIGRRKEWFERMQQAFMVLWWVPQGHIPTLEEAKGRLDRLQSQGPTAAAFTFKQPFPATDQVAS